MPKKDDKKTQNDDVIKIDFPAKNREITKAESDEQRGKYFVDPDSKQYVFCKFDLPTESELIDMLENDDEPDEDLTQTGTNTNIGVLYTIPHEVNPQTLTPEEINKDIADRIRSERKNLLKRDNSKDQISDPELIKEFEQEGYHIVTNDEIANGVYYDVDGTETVYYLNYVKKTFRDGTKIVLSTRQNDVYTMFPTLHAYPKIFTYDELRRILDQTFFIIDENRVEIDKLFKDFREKNLTKAELQNIINRFETLTGVRLEGITNGSVNFTVAEPIRTVAGLKKYPSSDVLSNVLMGTNLAHNYGLKPKKNETPEQALQNRTDEINKMLATRSNKHTKVLIDVSPIDANGYQLKLKHTTPTKVTRVTIPLTPTLLSKHSNFYTVWFELIGMATRDMLYNNSDPDATTGEFNVKYSYFGNGNPYSRTEDVKRALYKNEEFETFISGISGSIVPNKNASQYSVYNQVKRKKEKNNIPLKEINAIFTSIKFFDDYFCVQYSKSFEWEIFYNYFIVYPDGWQALNNIPRSMLHLILNQYRIEISAVKVYKGIIVSDVTPNQIKITNRYLQQVCLGKSEQTVTNATTQIKKLIVDAVSEFNEWFIENQPTEKQINIEFYGNIGYGKITNFLDECGIIVNFGSAYIDYAAEQIYARIEEIEKTQTRAKNRKTQTPN